FWVCKRAPAFVYEAMECLGGNGYVEESLLPRLYREAPVNAIWEGSGNVMCLDVLRAFGQDRDTAQALLRSLINDAAGLPGARASVDLIERVLSDDDGEAHARTAVESLAGLAAAAALRVGAPALMAELFADTHFGGGRLGAMFGTSELNAKDASVVLERAL